VKAINLLRLSVGSLSAIPSVANPSSTVVSQ